MTQGFQLLQILESLGAVGIDIGRCGGMLVSHGNQMDRELAGKYEECHWRDGISRKTAPRMRHPPPRQFRTHRNAGLHGFLFLGDSQAMRNRVIQLCAVVGMNGIIVQKEPVCTGSLPPPLG